MKTSTKRTILAMLAAVALPSAALAQYEEETANGVVSLAGREGFSIETKKGDFVFKLLPVDPPSLRIVLSVVFGDFP